MPSVREAQGSILPAELKWLGDWPRAIFLKHRPWVALTPQAAIQGFAKGITVVHDVALGMGHSGDLKLNASRHEILYIGLLGEFCR